MRLICDLNSPCPSQDTVSEKDVCLKEEGECEYQRLEEPNEDAEDIDNFVVNYKNGTSKTVNKGFFCEMKPEEGSYNMTFHMVDIAGTDLSAIVMGCIHLADKMGLFREKNSCQNEECPYHEETEECPAGEGCAGYEGADGI